MKKAPWISSLILLAIAACTNHADQQVTTTTAPPVADSTDVTNNAVRSSFAAHFPLWFQWVKDSEAAFTADDMIETETASIPSFPPDPIDTARLQPYKPLLIYNADRSKAVDLFSYNYMLSPKNGGITAEAAGPDTEVALVDFTDKKTQRIWYSGPSTAALDAAWLNNDKVAIAGLQQNESGEQYPAIWVVNLTDHTTSTYVYQHAVALTATTYQNKRYSDMTFR